MLEYKRYLKSKKWLELRLDILTNRPNCERCGSVKRLQVHHLTYDRLGREEPRDLEVLCNGCHLSEHGLLKPNKHHQKPKKRIILTPEQKALKRKKKREEKRKRRIKRQIKGGYYKFKI